MGFLIVILTTAINCYSMVIVFWVVLSWFRTAHKTVNDIYKVLDKIVAPYVNIFRKIIPTVGGLDFSPMIALIVLQAVVWLLARLFW